MCAILTATSCAASTSLGDGRFGAARRRRRAVDEQISVFPLVDRGTFVLVRNVARHCLEQVRMDDGTLIDPELVNDDRELCRLTLEQLNSNNFGELPIGFGDRPRLGARHLYGPVPTGVLRTSSSARIDG